MSELPRPEDLAGLPAEKIAARLTSPLLHHDKSVNALAYIDLLTEALKQYAQEQRPSADNDTTLMRFAQDCLHAWRGQEPPFDAMEVEMLVFCFHRFRGRLFS